MLEKFEKVATRSSFVDYYGEFNGRYEHSGYAVIAEVVSAFVSDRGLIRTVARFTMVDAGKCAQRPKF